MACTYFSMETTLLSILLSSIFISHILRLHYTYDITKQQIKNHKGGALSEPRRRSERGGGEKKVLPEVEPQSSLQQPVTLLTEVYPTPLNRQTKQKCQSIYCVLKHLSCTWMLTFWVTGMLLSPFMSHLCHGSFHSYFVFSTQKPLPYVHLSPACSLTVA
jgi:hypothetical protein